MHEERKCVDDFSDFKSIVDKKGIAVEPKSDEFFKIPGITSKIDEIVSKLCPFMDPNRREIWLNIKSSNDVENVSLVRGFNDDDIQNDVRKQLLKITKNKSKYYIRRIKFEQYVPLLCNVIRQLYLYISIL